ncbi:MAG: NDP-sugar synthase [bacterium]
MKAVLIAGGQGKRLRPLTDAIPKPMVKVAGEPIIVHQIYWLRGFGIKKFILAVSHLKEVIIDIIDDGSKLGVQVEYVAEEYPMGTAGALFNTKSRVKLDNERILCLNGDVLTTLNITGLIETLNSKPEAVGVLSLVPLPSPYGVVKMQGNFIQGFMEKPVLKDHWINAGVYCFRPEIFSALPNQGSLELDVFPKLARQQKLLAYKEPNCFWTSIDGFKDLENATKFYQEQAVLAKRGT